MSANRRHSRRQLDNLYADLSPKQRRYFFVRAYERLERWCDELDKLRAPEAIRSFKLIIECFEALAGIQERADKRGDPARKLIAAVLVQPNPSAYAIAALRAALDEAMERGDHKTAGALAKQYADAIAAAPGAKPEGHSVTITIGSTTRDD